MKNQALTLLYLSVIIVCLQGTPHAPEMTVSPSSSIRGSNDYREGDILLATCDVRDGRPAANITWFLGSDIITTGITSGVEFDERQKMYTTRSNLTKTLSWKDNTRDLRCVSEPIDLDLRNHPGKTLNVRYAPRNMNDTTILHYGFIIGKTGIMKVEVFAIPKPSFTWIVGTTQVLEGERDAMGKLEANKGGFMSHSFRDSRGTSDTTNIGFGTWEAVLFVINVTMEDVGRDYYLKASNSEGERTYRVAIPTITEPQGSPNVVVIIIIVSVVMLIVGVTAVVVVTLLLTLRNRRIPGDPATKNEGYLESVSEEAPLSGVAKIPVQP